MKNFYVIRDCPYPAPKDKDTIGYDRVIAQSWDVKYIWQANDSLPAQCLHKHPDGSLIYFEQTDYQTFNMLDAFGIPHLKNDRTTLNPITPQVVANKDGSCEVTIAVDEDENKPTPIGQYLKMLRK
jgi:hypothetical protein